jgi:predicted transcriptional regulator
MKNMKFEPLSEIELNVYRIMQMKIKKMKNFDLNTALPICFTKLGGKYSELAITKAVNSLIKKRYFIQGTSLTKDDISSNRVRQKIFHYIQRNPGAYNRLIRRELSLGSNEFNWHAGMLEKFGFIKKIQYNRSFGYFENKTYMGHEYDLFLLQNHKIHKIIEFLKTNRATLSQIAKKLEMHYNTIQKHVQILEERELVLCEITFNQKHKYYFYNENTLIKLQKIINGQIFIEFA